MKRDWHTTMGRREWLLKRNCSLTPRQTVAAWALLLALSLAVGLFFTAQGAPYVLVFSVIEMSAVTAAFIVYSRHATDYDRIVLEEGRLLVEQVRAGHTHHASLDTGWVRVTAPRRRRDPVRLEARGVAVDVGSYLLPAGRQLLARELRAELLAR